MKKTLARVLVGVIIAATLAATATDASAQWRGGWGGGGWRGGGWGWRGGGCCWARAPVSVRALPRALSAARIVAGADPGHYVPVGYGGLSRLCPSHSPVPTPAIGRLSPSLILYKWFASSATPGSRCRSAPVTHRRRRPVMPGHHRLRRRRATPVRRRDQLRPRVLRRTRTRTRARRSDGLLRATLSLVRSGERDLSGQRRSTPSLSVS